MDTNAVSTCSYSTKRPRLSPQNTMSGPSSSAGPSSSGERNRNSFIEPTDEQLMYWQERQITKCIFDNTVNRVVESYLTFFEEEGEDVRRQIDDALPDIPDTIPNRTANGVHLEDSAVLWAIEEHGLHQMGGSSLSLSSSSSSTSSTESNMRLLYTPPDRISSDSSDSEEPTQIAKPLNINLHLLPEVNSTSADTNELENSTNENEHIDFMEAAVAVAIQKKGLSMQTSPNR